MGLFSRDTELPRLYDTVTEMPPADGDERCAAASLAAVELPPPTVHERLYGSDFHSTLLTTLETRLDERFDDLVLPMNVWAGTYEDAKVGWVRDFNSTSHLWQCPWQSLWNSSWRSPSRGALGCVLGACLWVCL